MGEIHSMSIQTWNPIIEIWPEVSKSNFYWYYMQIIISDTIQCNTNVICGIGLDIKGNLWAWPLFELLVIHRQDRMKLSSLNFVFPIMETGNLMLLAQPNVHFLYFTCNTGRSWDFGRSCRLLEFNVLKDSLNFLSIYSIINWPLKSIEFKWIC